MSFDDLRAGLSVEQAVEAFLDGCNKGPDRLWISESWVRRRIERLIRLARSPLTEEHAAKLRDAALKREGLDYVIDWMCDHSDLRWSEFDEMCRQQEADRVWTKVREAFLQSPVNTPFRQEPYYGGVEIGGAGPGAAAHVCSDRHLDALESHQAKECLSCGCKPDRFVRVIFFHQRGRLRGRSCVLRATLCASCGILVDRISAVWTDENSVESGDDRAGGSESSAAVSRSHQSLDALAPDSVQAAVDMLRQYLSKETKRQLRELIAANPTDWMVTHHFEFGLTVRNLLRSRGFDERFFQIHNLDDYWADLARLAVDEFRSITPN